MIVRVTFSIPVPQSIRHRHKYIPNDWVFYYTGVLRLLPLREYVIQLYLHSALRTWYGESYSDNQNLRILRSNTKIFVTSGYPRSPLKPRFWHNSEICLLFTPEQQQIFITCCWQYHIRNQRTYYVYIYNNKFAYDRFKTEKFLFQQIRYVLVKFYYNCLLSWSTPQTKRYILFINSFYISLLH